MDFSDSYINHKLLFSDFPIHCKMLEKVAFLNELGNEIKMAKVKYSNGRHASKKSAPWPAFA